MTHVITENFDGTTTIRVSFHDEDVELTGETQVKGRESDALAYLSVFEADLRNNFADRFPVPESEDDPEDGGIE